jgi:hypothetical protein
MTLAQLIEAGLKNEIAEAGRTITDPAALQRWMSERGIGRSAMSAATGADYNAVQSKERAGVRGPQATGTDAYERLSQPLTPEHFPGDAANWNEWKPKDILIERLSAALEMMRHPDAHWIVELYVEHDRRFPDTAGFNVWTGLLDDGEAPDDVRGWIISGFAR